MIEQEANQLQQQMQMIEQHIKDMQELNSGLDELEKFKGKEIRANIGKGIYIPAEITDKNLIVEIGNKTLVKKTIPETKKIIEEQLGKLISEKGRTMERLEMMQEEMMRLIQNYQNSQNSKEDKESEDDKSN